MANWKRMLDLSDLWQKYVIDDEVSDLDGLNKAVIQRIRAFDPELEDIVSEFECVSDSDDFDAAMSALYDYADDERIWVKVLI